MTKKLTGYKKNMALLGQKMIAEELKNEIKNSIENDKVEGNKILNTKLS